MSSRLWMFFLNAGIGAGLLVALESLLNFFLDLRIDSVRPEVDLDLVIDAGDSAFVANGVSG